MRMAFSASPLAIRQATGSGACLLAAGCTTHGSELVAGGNDGSTSAASPKSPPRCWVASPPAVQRGLSRIIFHHRLGVGAALLEAATTITFTGAELLGRPTDSSVMITIVPDSTIENTTSTGLLRCLHRETLPATATGGQPGEGGDRGPGPGHPLLLPHEVSPARRDGLGDADRTLLLDAAGTQQHVHVHDHLGFARQHHVGQRDHLGPDHGQRRGGDYP